MPAKHLMSTSKDSWLLWWDFWALEEHFQLRWANDVLGDGTFKTNSSRYQTSGIISFLPLIPFTTRCENSMLAGKFHIRGCSEAASNKTFSRQRPCHYSFSTPEGALLQRNYWIASKWAQCPCTRQPGEHWRCFSEGTCSSFILGAERKTPPALRLLKS